MFADHALATYRLKPGFLKPGLVADMRLEQWLLTTVAYVGSESKDGRFLPLGTGFLVATSYKGFEAALLVTASHVIDDAAGDTISYRLNRKGGGVGVITLPKKDVLVPHPDKSVDLTAFFTTHDQSIYDGKYFNLSRQSHQEWLSHYSGIELGDEVAVIGLYTSHYGLEQNVPVARTGNISAMPHEPINCGGRYTNGLLIEVRSLGGLSGSPVFYGVPPAFRKDGSVAFAKLSDYHPVGILLGHHTVESDEDEIQVPKFQHETGNGPPQVRKEKNTGLGVVLPIERVFEIVESQRFKDMCDESIKAIQSASGYKPDSANPAVKGTEQAHTNSQHKEAFTSLLNAAVRTKPQDD